MRFFALVLLASLIAGVSAARADDDPLAVGVAGHAFDHLGSLGEQSEAAAASGANIIYATGMGSIGYTGLPPAEQFAQSLASSRKYAEQSKARGIRLAIGYVCATSIVKLESFDQNWPAQLRQQLESAPSSWLQQDRNGNALPSWYGGDYRPACMNHPDWRTYEKFMVGVQLNCGHDGIFFDNPTVHPEGCYCQHCMTKFGAFIKVDAAFAELRKLAIDRPKDFLRFRGTIAADFLAEMRAHARTINPKAIVTCNNSLNSPDAFFSQIRTYGYNIFELAKVEDIVLVEDMATQPRTLPDGSVIEYGPVYEMLRAIAHGKPIVAVTLADGDYHTPANLVRLAMAEAAAHEASYLSWPTWPAEVREKMAAAIKPQADFLRANAELLNGTNPVVDEVVALPFEQWVEGNDCPALARVRALAAQNVQFSVKTGADAVVCTARTIVTENGPKVRAVVRKKDARTIVHLLNYDIQKRSSFEDRVTPAADVRVRLACSNATKVRALSADTEATRGPIEFRTAGGMIEFKLPRLVISTILVVE
jgi:hypothetical protein